ncbi:MAG TPA: DUF998 domain-containing protein [Ktedonobacterales bacterium]
MTPTIDVAQSVHGPFPTLVRVGAIVLCATSVFFVAQIIAQLAWPGYSVSQYDVSALGVTQCGQYTNGSGGLSFYACSPLHMVMNAGFILVGAFTSAGIILTRSIWPRRRLTRVGVAFVAVSGLGGILAGLFPANLNFGLHVLGALMNFLFAGSGILLLGAGVRKRNGGLAAWSLMLGGIAIMGLILYNSQIFLGLGPGGMERVLGFSPVVWAIGLGVALLFRGHTGNRAAISS